MVVNKFDSVNVAHHLQHPDGKEAFQSPERSAHDVHDAHHVAVGKCIHYGCQVACVRPPVEEDRRSCAGPAKRSQALCCILAKHPERFQQIEAEPMASMRGILLTAYWYTTCLVMQSIWRSLEITVFSHIFVQTCHLIKRAYRALPHRKLDDEETHR